MNAGASYLAHIKEKDAQIVDVTVPSGFVFQFRKPGVYGSLFGIGGLPQNVTSGVVAEWVKEGVLEVGDGEGALSPDAAKQLNMGMAVVDRVLHLSHRPKLVSGIAQNDNELSTDDMDEEDLSFLFRWVASGGHTSQALETFPDGPKSNALASAHREKQRKESE